MADYLKNERLRTVQVVRLALSTFAKNHPYRTVYLAILVFSILIKNLCYLVERVTTNEMSQESVSMEISLVRILILRIGAISLNFYSDAFFQEELIQYGMNITKKALVNILFSDSTRIFTQPVARTEYFITEGAKALARINKAIITGLISKSIHVIFDMWFIYSIDKTDTKTVFITVIIFLTIFSALKMRLIRKQLKSKKTAENCAFEMEKQYVETIDQSKIIKSYRMEDPRIKLYEKKILLWEGQFSSYHYMGHLNDMTYDTLCAFFKIGVTLLHSYYHERQNIAQILTILEISNDVIKTATNLTSIYTRVMEATVLSNMIVYYLKLAVEDLNQKLRVDTLLDKITVENLTYVRNNKTILSSVNLTLNKGDKAALIGKNGAGKSSIFKVLMNFDEYSGIICWDDIDIQRIAMLDYRKMFTYVPQDTKLFDETIYFNLTFGNNMSYEIVIKECMKIGIHETIMRFPSGYNTSVGECGKKINGGLRQMIFYVRAFLCDTPVYLLDEPTNNLDEKHSKFLLNYLQRPEFDTKTFFVICHDLELVNSFPKIYQFQNGEIILKNPLIND